MHKEQRLGRARRGSILLLQSDSSRLGLCPRSGAHSMSFHQAEVFTLRSHSHVSEPFSLGQHHLDGLQCNLSAVIAFAREGTKAVRVAVVSFCIPYVRSLLHKQCGDCREDISLYLLWGNSLSERNHNSNDKSCVVSR